MPQYLRDIYPRPFKSVAERISGRIRKSREEDAEPSWLNSIKGFLEGAVEGTGDLFTNDPSDFMGSRAGVPFDKYPIKQIHHGTQRLFDKFDPDRYDKSDVLGWMTHGAEDPEYAGIHYAMGRSKGLKTLSDKQTHPDVDLDSEYWDYQKGGYSRAKVVPHMIPMKPEAKNVLDLVDPNPDDLSQALAALSPERRRELISEFKAARRTSKTYHDEDPRQLANTMGVQWSHLTDNMTHKEIPSRVVADKLRLTPEEFDKTPFDAIRYRDNEHKSWAIPERTPIRSAISPELILQEPKAKPIKVIKTQEPMKGSLELNLGNFSAPNYRDFAIDKQEEQWAIPEDIITDFDNIPKTKANIDSWNDYLKSNSGQDWAKETTNKLFSNEGNILGSPKNATKFPNSPLGKKMQAAVEKIQAKKLSDKSIGLKKKTTLAGLKVGDKVKYKYTPEFMDNDTVYEVDLSEHMLEQLQYLIKNKQIKLIQ